MKDNETTGVRQCPDREPLKKRELICSKCGKVCGEYCTPIPFDDEPSDSVREECDNLKYNDMSLRDYFAGQANEEDLKPYLITQYTRSEARYRHTDAMLKERNKC